MSLRGLLTMLLLAGVLGCGGKPTLPPIVVGHVATLSGPDRRAGLQASRGLKLALEEVNKDAERRIDVRHTDTLGNVDAFESQAVRLVAVNGARALFGGDTPDEVFRLGQAVPADTKEQPVFLPIISTCGWRTPLMSKQVILTGMTPQAEGKALANFAVEDKKVVQALLLVDQADERAVAAADAFLREFMEARRKKSLDAEPARPRKLLYGGDAKLDDVLAQLAAEKPQAVLVAGSKADLRQASEKLEQTGDEPKQPAPILLFASPDGSIRPDDWLILTKNGVGPVVYVASAFGLDKESDFAERFRKQFKEEPDVHAALAYEGMKLLAEPLRAGFAEQAKLRDELFKIKDFAGLAGPLNIDGDQAIVRSLLILQLQRDQMKVVRK